MGKGLDIREGNCEEEGGDSAYYGTEELTVVFRLDSIYYPMPSWYSIIGYREIYLDTVGIGEFLNWGNCSYF